MRKPTRDQTGLKSQFEPVHASVGHLSIIIPNIYRVCYLDIISDIVNCKNA